MSVTSTSLTPLQAMDDDALLGASFQGASWDLWRAVLKAAFAEPMTEAELSLFREVADRDPPKHRVRELWALAGRRAGKDSIAALIATVAAVQDYSSYLRPGERASVMCLASDRVQSKLAHRYILGNFENTPLLSSLITRTTDDVIELNNRVEIVVQTNSFRAVRGRSVCLAILDEVCYWRSDESATPDVETYKALEPALGTLPNSMLIGISSPYRRAGLAYETWKEFYGSDSDDILVVRGATRTFNPSFSQEIVDRALQRDPERYAAEYLGAWRSDIAAFVVREVIDACTVPGRHELPPLSHVHFYAFLDAAGGSGSDSMTIAIAFYDSTTEKAVLAAIRERRPPFSPSDVVAEFVTLMKAYRVSRAQSDRWGGDWVTESFRKHNIIIEPCAKPKSELYQEILPQLNSGRIELLDNQKLATQFCALERRTARGGKSSIDHPPGNQHDDVCNAVAGVLLMVSAKRGAWSVSAEALALASSSPRRRNFSFDYAARG